MEIISTAEFNALGNNPIYKVIKYTPQKKIKVIETSENSIIKIFYRKRKWYSSDHYYPRAKKFYDNAQKLRALNISAPKINKIQYCPELKLHVVVYEKCPGVELRELLKQGDTTFLTAVVGFVAQLHEKGIFFRALHMENLLYHSEIGFLLIDLVDMRFKRKPLNLFLRYRNIKHLFYVKEDHAYWKTLSAEYFLKIYLAHTHLSWLSKIIFKFLIKNLWKTTKVERHITKQLTKDMHKSLYK